MEEDDCRDFYSMFEIYLSLGCILVLLLKLVERERQVGNKYQGKIAILAIHMP